MKEMSDLICGKAAVGGNYNSTRDIHIRHLRNVLTDWIRKVRGAGSGLVMLLDLQKMLEIIQR